ncbi:MAG: RNA polymerase sporulation sigma factor SigK [Christensenellaceae bacterium]|nr:RNA polymerase sporulation sigma factor SigK [Christensenellaceae bacterium]
MLEGFFAVLSNIMLFTAKLENTNSFPRPLSPERESEYLIKFKEHNDMEARDILIKHNLRLVVFIAKKYTNYPDRDDLISIGTMGLIKGINSYEMAKGAQLATYVSRCIENEILMTMRTYKRTQGDVSLYENMGCDKDGNEVRLIDLLSVEEETVYAKLETEMERSLLIRMINKYLKKREGEIIKMRFGLCNETQHTQQQVSDKLGISRSYVSRIEKLALYKLKCGLEKEDALL